MFIALTFISACTLFENEVPETKIVVSAFGKNLLLDSLCVRIPNDLSFEDSTLLSERIIEGWVRENVLLAQAEANINEFSRAFEASVVSYRNALLVTQFEREFIASRVDTEVLDDEIENFHSQYPELFILKEHVLRAVFFEINTEEEMLPNKGSRREFTPPRKFQGIYSIHGRIGKVTPSRAVNGIALPPVQ